MVPTARSLPPWSFSSRMPPGRRGADADPFAAHAVAFDILGLDLLEGGFADLQRDLQQGMFPAQAPQDLGGEMQPGRGRGDRAGMQRIDRLVALKIETAPLGRLPCPALDVGRQRGESQLEHLRVVAVEEQPAPAALAPGDHLGLQPVLGAEHGSRLEMGRRLAKDLELPVTEVPDHEHFSRPAVDASEKAGRQHARIVHDQEIPGGEQVGKVMEGVVGDPAAGAFKPQQLGIVAALGRETGDPFLGQRKIKIG